MLETILVTLMLVPSPASVCGEGIRGCAIGQTMVLPGDHQVIKSTVRVRHVEWAEGCERSLACYVDGEIRTPFTRFHHARLAELGEAVAEAVGVEYRDTRLLAHEFQHLLGYDHP